MVVLYNNVSEKVNNILSLKSHSWKISQFMPKIFVTTVQLRESKCMRICNSNLTFLFGEQVIWWHQKLKGNTFTGELTSLIVTNSELNWILWIKLKNLECHFANTVMCVFILFRFMEIIIIIVYNCGFPLVKKLKIRIKQTCIWINSHLMIFFFFSNKKCANFWPWCNKCLRGKL